MLERKPNNDEQLDDNKFGSFRTLEESISLILRQWQFDDINNLVQILAIYSVKEDRIYLSSFFFYPKTIAPLGPDQLFGMTSNFIFSDNNTISGQVTMQKQVAKNVME